MGNKLEGIQQLIKEEAARRLREGVATDVREAFDGIESAIFKQANVTNEIRETIRGTREKFTEAVNSYERGENAREDYKQCLASLSVLGQIRNLYNVILNKDLHDLLKMVYGEV